MDLKLLKQIEDLFPKNKHKSKNPSLNINDQQILTARELTGTDEDNSNDETDDSKKKKKLSNDETKKKDFGKQETCENSRRFLSL